MSTVSFRKKKEKNKTDSVSFILLFLSLTCMYVWLNAPTPPPHPHPCVYAQLPWMHITQHKVPSAHYANSCKIWPQLLHQKIDFSKQTVGHYQNPIFKMLSKFKFPLQDLWEIMLALAFQQMSDYVREGKQGPICWFKSSFQPWPLTQENIICPSSGPRDFLCHVSKMTKNKPTKTRKKN